MDNSTAKEIFKDVKGFEGSYQISNFGNIKSLDRVNGKGTSIKGKLLKTRVNNSGYRQVMLSNGSRKNKKNLFIHRLVAINFIGESEENVNHKDGNKMNNSVTNLEWVSKSENTKHAYSNGLVRKCKRVKVIFSDGNEIIMNNSAECCRYFGFNHRWVADRVKRHGSTFEFEGHIIQVME